MTTANRVSISIRNFGRLREQGHHHNGDRAARRPHMMCSICVRRSTTPLFGGTYGSGWPHSVARLCIPISTPPIDTYGLCLTIVELFSWLQKRFCPPVRPRYGDKYRSRRYCFVERQKPANDRRAHVGWRHFYSLVSSFRTSIVRCFCEELVHRGINKVLKLNVVELRWINLLPVLNGQLTVIFSLHPASSKATVHSICTSLETESFFVF